MLELCAGTLEQFIKEAYKGPEFSPDKIDLYQIACGVHYIHSKKLVNRDIKPENTWLKTHFPYRSGDESFRFWDEQVRNSRGSQVRIPSVDSKGHRLRLDGSKVSIAMVISEEENCPTSFRQKWHLLHGIRFLFLRNERNTFIWKEFTHHDKHSRR